MNRNIARMIPVQRLLLGSTHGFSPGVQVKEGNGVVASRRATWNIGRPLLTSRAIQSTHTNGHTHGQTDHGKSDSRKVISVYRQWLS